MSIQSEDSMVMHYDNHLALVFSAPMCNAGDFPGQMLSFKRRQGEQPGGVHGPGEGRGWSLSSNLKDRDNHLQRGRGGRFKVCSAKKRLTTTELILPIR